MRAANSCLCRLAPLLVIISLPAAAAQEKPARKTAAGTVLVVVNGDPITETELKALMRRRQVPANREAGLRQQFLDQLIDAKLIADYLARRKTAADKALVDEQIENLKEIARKQKKDPGKLFAERGYTEEALRAEIGLSLAWRKHFNRVVTEKTIRKFFAAHRRELDGTEIRAAHVVIKVDTSRESDALKATEDQLDSLAADIRAKRITFAQAAQRHSTGPSKTKGGDLGFFLRYGKMPEEISRRAFSLKPGEVSKPFRTRFGVHICTVLEEEPGELSLEDARKEVLKRLSQQLWNETAASERKTAKIDKPRSRGTPGDCRGPLL